MKPESVGISRSFHLLQPLGEGSMGVVYEAVDPELGQRIAVKFLHPEAAADPEIRDRFRAEAEIMAAIDHPGNLPIFGCGSDPDGRPFYAMKMISGKTLEEVLAERGDRATDLSWLRRLMDDFEAVCDTVACAHEAGIVHRDLKPENILVDEDRGTVHVVDWGIAKRVGSSGTGGSKGGTVFGRVMGTPGYLSPEQARGDSADAGPTADVFALGVILYRILTGEQPFVGENQRQVVLSAIHRQPTDPRRFNPWVSRSSAAICRKALEKEPSRRYATARALAADIRALREGRRVSVGRPSIIERFRGWSLRRPTQAATALAAAISLVVLTAFVGVQVWGDARLAEKALETVVGIDSRIAEIDRDLRALDGRSESLEQARSQLARERLVQELRAMVMLSSVTHLRFIRKSDELLALNRARVFDVIESSLRYGEPDIAWAIGKEVFENHQRGVSALALSPSEVERLRALVAEAETALASPQNLSP